MWKGIEMCTAAHIIGTQKGIIVPSHSVSLLTIPFIGVLVTCNSNLSLSFTDFCPHPHCSVMFFEFSIPKDVSIDCIIISIINIYIYIIIIIIIYIYYIHIY